MAIRLTPEEFARDLPARLRKLPVHVKKGIVSGMHRGRRVLTKRTPVDLGQMKNAWRVDPVGMEIQNDAPHAGIIERGARPHKVNRAGREALTRWAMRQLGVDEKTARSIAHGIAKKLEKKGQKGRFIVEEAMPRLRKEVVDEVFRLIRLQGNRRSR